MMEKQAIYNPESFDKVENESPVTTSSEAHPASYPVGTGVLPRG